jgi:hypothetical protein
MSNRRHFVCQAAAALLACGLIASLLLGFAAAQEGAGKPPSTGKCLPDMPMQAPPENFLVPSASAAGKPNVVLFVVDDMGWMDAGAYGSKYCATPATAPGISASGTSA